MGRKKPEPRHLGEEERRQVDWNMQDIVGGQLVQQPDLVIVPDNDPALTRELEAAGDKTLSDENAKSEIYSVHRITESAAQNESQNVKSEVPLASENLHEPSVPENIRQFFRKPEVKLPLEEIDWSLCVPLYRPSHRFSKEIVNNWHWQTGKFTVQLYDVDELPLTADIGQCLSDFQQCCLYIALENEHKPIIYFEVYDREVEQQSLARLEAEGKSKWKRKQSVDDRLGLFWTVDFDFKDAWKFFQKLNRSVQKKFLFVLGEFDSVGKQFEVTVYGRKDSLQNLVYPSQGFVLRDVNQFLLEAMQHFYDLGPVYGKSTRTLHQDFQELYEGVRALQTSETLTVEVDVQHPCLKPHLRPYQRDAVRWMLQRERFGEEHMPTVFEDDDLHPLYTEVTTLCGKTLYYNRQGGSLILDKPRRTVSPPGGILADEMGLGKTVEVLCCLLLHPRPALPPPPRMPTLMETQFQEDSEESSMDTSSVSRSSSMSDLPCYGTYTVEMSLTQNRTLKRAASDSCSLSSVASEFISYEFTEDHSYQDKCLRKDVDDGKKETDTTETDVVEMNKTETDKEEINETEVDSSNLDKTELDEAKAYETKIDILETDEADMNKVESSKVETNKAKMNKTNTEKAETNKVEFNKVATNRAENGNTNMGKAKSNKADTDKAETEDSPSTSSTDRQFQSPFTLKFKRVEGNKYKIADDSQPESKKKRTKEKKKEGELEVERNSQTSTNKRKRLSTAIEDGNHCEEERVEKRKRSNTGFEYMSSAEYYRTCGVKSRVVHKPQLFECTCGKGENELMPGKRSRLSRKTNRSVKCIECGTSQHAGCMNYDLNDPWRGPYKCPHCHYNGKPVPSGATLIISPFSIAHQWIDEIRKHIQEKSLKVFVYTGVRHQGYVQPQTLASQDIVITTYETLRNEVNYVNLKPTNGADGRRLRNPKKFMAQPTPLTAVEWWRICLDEAQMVESVTTKTADMALRLSCVNRWCVTGTPLNQSIKDVYGLLAFISHDPYCVESWWTRCLYEPYLQGFKQPMLRTLASVMWRSSMKHVRHQLNLPDKSEEVKYLTFSPVEDAFYRRLYHKCSNEIVAVTFRLSEKEKSTKLRKLDHHTVNKYLIPLRKLRQACCHPQAVSGSSLSMKNSVMTMEELLDNLIKKTMVEVTESHRSMIAAMNAQAGIFLIEHTPRVVEAVGLYREVLRCTEELEQDKEVKTDTLPRVHTLHNLALVLATKPPGVGATLRDDHLNQQCEELKQQYLQRAGSGVTASEEQLAPLQQSARQLSLQLGKGTPWYQVVMSHAHQAGNDGILIDKVRKSLDVLLSEAPRHFSNLSGLQYIVMAELSELQASRDKLLSGMRRLDKTRLKERAVQEEVIQCCLRPLDGVQLNTCVFCNLDMDFLNLEGRLFGMVIQQRDWMGHVNTRYRDGSWKASPVEIILKSILSYARSYRLEGDILTDGSTHISLLDVWKKEFKQLRALWTKLREEVSAVDELEMAVTRMRLRLPDENAPSFCDTNICEKTELASLLQRFSSQQKLYASQLKARCGQLDYLRNLAKGNSGEFQDGINPEECPICKGVLGRNWSVLQCGHCSCITCIQQLINHCPASRTSTDIAVKCMICRERTKTSEISYVSTSRPADDDSSIKGSYSSKVKAILQCIQHIQSKEPGAKAIVFATWLDVLKLIGKALDENNIHYTHLFDHGSHFEKNVALFRTDSSVNVLLLAYSSGSKGLNLFEANHVLLVEPTFSPSEEAQAVGRVFRMGQTKPTTIHRFLVKRTIEARIHRLMESTLRPAASANEADKDAITLGQLISLFDDGDAGNDEHEETSEDAGNWSMSGNPGGSSE